MVISMCYIFYPVHLLCFFLLGPEGTWRPSRRAGPWGRKGTSVSSTDPRHIHRELYSYVKVQIFCSGKTLWWHLCLFLCVVHQLPVLIGTISHRIENCTFMEPFTPLQNPKQLHCDLHFKATQWLWWTDTRHTCLTARPLLFCRVKRDHQGRMELRDSS